MFSLDPDGSRLLVSTCDFDSSEDTIEFYTCSGGPYCDMPDNPTTSAVFSYAETQLLTINVNDDVPPTTLVISKPAGTDGWYVRLSSIGAE